MEAVYVFGNVGNLEGCLGEGWSVEDQYAWTIGQTSHLRLPLPGDDAAYLVRFNVHPLVYADLRPSQRLTVLAGHDELARVTLDVQGPVEVPLPLELTRHKAEIALTLLHPDGIRPSEARQIGDTRLLSLCFHSASLVRLEDVADPAARRSRPATIAPRLQAIVAGAFTAQQVARILEKTPEVRERLAVQYVDLDQPVTDPATAQAVESAQICWLQADVGHDSERRALQERLPAACEVMSFPTPHCQALWPFQGRDPRAVPEPPLYPQGRYPVTDRLAASLANVNMADDVVLLVYEAMVETELPDLDAALAADVATWRSLDARCDVRLADTMADGWREQRWFIAPTIPGCALLRTLALRLADTEPARGRLAGIDVGAGLDRLLRTYVGRREEVPILPRVARHFRLSWWTEDMTYRWFNNRYGFRDYVINYIRWAPWRA